MEELDYTWLEGGFMTVNEFIDWARIRRTKTYQEIGAGRLRAFKVGRRTLIRRSDAERWAISQMRPLCRTPEEVFGMGPPDGP